MWMGVHQELAKRNNCEENSNFATDKYSISYHFS